MDLNSSQHSASTVVWRAKCKEVVLHSQFVFFADFWLRDRVSYFVAALRHIRVTGAYSRCHFEGVDAGTQRSRAARMQECRVQGAECRIGAHRSARELSTGVPSGASRTSRSRQPDEHGAVREPRPRA